MDKDKRIVQPFKLTNKAMLLLVCVSVVPFVSAAPSTVDGLSGVVTAASGSEQTIWLKFPLDDNDGGTYEYNITVDAGIPVDIGDTGTDRASYSGFGLAPVEFFGAPTTYTFTVHSWDGATEGTPSCGITLDVSVIGAQDKCGVMDPTYANEFCTSLTEDKFGFAHTERVDVTSDGSSHDDQLRFWASGSQAAYGGINLGQDTADLSWAFEVESNNDGGSSKILFFFSEVPTEVSKTSAGDGATAVASGFGIPHRGAYATGFGAALKEDGADYQIKMFYNTGGATTILFEDTWSAGIDANSRTEGTVTVSPYRDLFLLELGTESYAVSISQQARDPAPFYSFWVNEYGGGIFTLAVSFHAADGTNGEVGTNGCISSIDSALGGAGNAIGAPSNIQPVETFEGEGGYITDPSVPFVDVNTMAEGWGIAPVFLAWMFSVIITAILSVGGWLLADKDASGAIVGAVVSVPVAALMGLNPLWLIVLIFLMAVAKLFLVSEVSA